MNKGHISEWLPDQWTFPPATPIPDLLTRFANEFRILYVLNMFCFIQQIKLLIVIGSNQFKWVKCRSKYLSVYIFFFLKLSLILLHNKQYATVLIAGCIELHHWKKSTNLATEFFQVSSELTEPSVVFGNNSV
jgi:hypothetical protein